MVRRVYPKLPDLPGVGDEALDSFDAYLTAVIEQATRAAKSSRPRAALFDHGWLKAQQAYWKNGKGILMWLRGQIRRQREARRRQAADRSGNGKGDDGSRRGKTVRVAGVPGDGPERDS